jgi:RND family efflux transporter MFP subunit
LKATHTALVVVLLGAMGAGGYWLGVRSVGPGHDSAASTAAATATPAARKPLYYRNPMGLADTSPTPKKDPMGMDYVPVFADEPAAGASTAGDGAAVAGQVNISTEKIQKLGVRIEAVTRRPLLRTVRAAGRVEPDERRIFVIAPRFEGYVEKLHVNVTGQFVARGQPLFDAYSPELVAAQREYLIATQGLQSLKDADAEAQGGLQQLAESSLQRLRNWDLSPAQVTALVQTGQPRRSISFPSPVAGVVTEKKALQGMRFMPGEMLYQVTDLSSVWVIADLPEQDIGLVRTGAAAKVTTTAYPNEVFRGRITYVYPTMKADTRSIPVRVELDNPGQRLKPAMFAQVELASGSQAPVLTVPDSAVIDTGTRRIVLVQVTPGRFEPREVDIGRIGEAYVEVVRGVAEGEQVVVAANFLIDAESNLKAAVGGLGGHAGHGQAATGPGTGAAAPSPAVPPTPPTAPTTSTRPQPGHQAQGTVDTIDLKAGTLRLNHGPVASLKWPAMTMAFKVANTSLLQGLQPGQAVSFEFVERQPGDYVVTSLRAATRAQQAPAAPRPQPAPASGAGAHSGH